MSYTLEHLRNGWEVDQAIQLEENCVVVIRFGQDRDPKSMEMDETLAKTKAKLANFVKIYVVDTNEVRDFDTFYDIQSKMALMFFYKNKLIQVDCGTGDNNKIVSPLDQQQFIDLCEVVYRGASKGRGLVQAPFDASTKSRY